MKMTDMDEILMNEGFNVIRTYISKNSSYEFIISKPGLGKLVEYFKYPEHETPNEKDKLQRAFIHLITRRYRVQNECGLTTSECTTVPTIKKVIFNDPATIILWADGTKTVVKCDGEDYDPEKGMAMAIAKKALGNKGNYYNTFKKWLPVPKPLSSWQDVVNAFTKLGEDFKKFNGRKKDRDDKEDKT